MNALLSVSDKRELVPFARGLVDRGWTLISTGGTARALLAAGLPVTGVAELTGHSEMLEGRVKTLHPAVHAGLLARLGQASDSKELRQAGYEQIDLVAVNLYPFREAVVRDGATEADALENIDIGGPTLIRAAAKNHPRVWPVVRPEDYGAVVEALDGDAERQSELRRTLATRAFAHTAAYDAAIAGYFASPDAAEEGDAAGLPQRLALSLHKVRGLRYGENPDQPAAFYAEGEGDVDAIPGIRQHHGKVLSYNNLVDLEAGRLAVEPWAAHGPAACAIIKHDTPCGIAVGDGAAEAYRMARETDPASAFGSVVVFNRPVTREAAELLLETFVEAVAAPGFAPRGLEMLREKKNLRLVEWTEATPLNLSVRMVRGGALVQRPMSVDHDESEWRVVTDRAPTDAEWEALRFAWRAVANVKSNAILLARAGRAVGIGAGQMSRVDASRLAVRKAREHGHDLNGAALASDAFFPFRDGIQAAAAEGITAVIQPGGSIRDREVVDAANEHGVAMVFTGRRLFRH